MPSLPSFTRPNAEVGPGEITAVSYLGGRLWRAKGWAKVRHRNSHYSTNTELVMDRTIQDEDERWRNSYFQPYAKRKAWSRTADGATEKCRVKLCATVQQDHAYFRKDADRKRRKEARTKRVEFDNPCKEG